MLGFLSATLKNYTLNYAGLSKHCWEGIALIFINATSVGICFFLSLYFVDSLHLSVALAGILISCYGLGTVTGGIFAGKLSDRISPLYISTFSLFLQSTAFLFLAQLQSSELFMANLFVLGFAAYGFKTSNNVWLLNQCNKQPNMRLKIVNISHAASNFGLGVSGVIIGTLANYGFENIFYMSSAFLLASAIYLSWQITSRSNSLNINNNFCIEEMENVQKNKKILFLILGCLFFVGLIVAQLNATYPIYIQEKFSYFGIKAISILFILDTVLIVLFQAPLVNLLNNCNKIFIVGLGAFFMGLGMLILVCSFNFALAIFSCVIWTAGEMLFMPMAQLVCYEKGMKKKKGQALGLFQTIFAMSSIIGPAMGSLVYQYLGGDVVWYVSGIIGIFCFIACYYHKKYD